MQSIKIASSQKRTTALLLHGTYITTMTLGILLVIFNGTVNSSWLGNSTWIVFAIALYLLTAEFFLRKNYTSIINWMLVTFYSCLAFCTLLFWGLNAPVGILTISFAIILPSILMGARTILPVALFSILMLVIIQIMHGSGAVTPELSYLSLPSSYWDVATYATILFIFALVSWVGVNQREKNLKRALAAESALKKQKDALSIELEKQSMALRLTQLNEIRQLHKFALLGQSTAATLHDLSNHLSVLNFDIDDLNQHNINSEAIKNAKDGIENINKMVRQARLQLTSYDHQESFNAISVINRSAKDLSNKFSVRQVKINKILPDRKEPFLVVGNPLALMQIITILLNNAIDACYEVSTPKVWVEVTIRKSRLDISIRDNGVGISDEKAKTLFNPIVSSKSAGLGVGLYIAKHLVEDQFNGKITLKSGVLGAHFLVTIPRRKTT